MPSPTLTTAYLELVGRGHCSECFKYRNIYTIVLGVVRGDAVLRTAQIKACAECLGSGEMAAAVAVKPSDVVDLRTKNHRRKINKTARKREAACAEEIGGHTPPQSGGGIAKGDARNDNWMIDDKHTKARQYNLTEAVVRKMIGEAKRSGRRGALKIGFQNGGGCEVAVLHWSDFMEMMDDENNRDSDDR